MAIEIVMPKLGWTMEEGVLAEWIKKDGDQVNVGDIIFAVESDKALQEVEAFDEGILHIPPDAPSIGSTIKVGGLLAYLLKPGEEPPTQQSHAEITATTMTAVTNPQIDAIHTPQSRRDALAISPRARRIASELNIDWKELHGSGRTGRIVERDVRAAVKQRSSQTAVASSVSPVARRAAQELGVDIEALTKQLPGKRIMRDDVEAAASAKPIPDALLLSQSVRHPMGRIRRAIAAKMTNSAHTTASVTLTTEVDATELVHLRKSLIQDALRIAPSYNDLLAKLSATALQEHPMLNARFEGDDIVQLREIHIGLAVDTERGLLVPVIRNVESKNIRQIVEESTSLVERARHGTVNSDALSGSTFTITNLGMYDIDMFTPIINFPECAILGVGRINPRQIVIDVEQEQVAIRHMMFMSLTFDHRLVDGAPAARFLQRIKQFVEQPYLWLSG